MREKWIADGSENGAVGYSCECGLKCGYWSFDKSKVLKVEAEHQRDFVKWSKALKIKEKEEKEEKERFREIVDDQQSQLQKCFESPEFKEVGKWFKDWIAHGNIKAVKSCLFCPKCGSDWRSLKWNCCDLEVDVAMELAWSRRGKASKKLEARKDLWI